MTRPLCLLALLALAGCGHTAIDGKPVTELADPAMQPPAALTAPCDAPVALPDAAMSAGAVERGWAADRGALAMCGARHQAETEFYAKRDAALAGKK